MANAYGYVRVSTREQHEDRQVAAMLEVGVEKDNIFLDKQSGKDFERPEYQRLLDTLTPGDLLYVKSIDRLGQNYRDIQDQWRMLVQDKGIDIVILDMPLLDTRIGKDLLGTFLSDMVLQLLSFVAENERDSIRKRQAEGIIAARTKGIRFGRPRVTVPEDFDSLIQSWKTGDITLNQAMEKAGMSKSTFFRRLRDSKKRKP